MRALAVCIALALATSSAAAQISTCRILEGYMLERDGKLGQARDLQGLVVDPTFVLDRSAGIATGKVFGLSVSWRVLERGSSSTTHKMLGTEGSAPPTWYLAVHDFAQGAKPFTLTDMWTATVVTGLCN